MSSEMQKMLGLEMVQVSDHLWRSTSSPLVEVEFCPDSIYVEHYTAVLFLDEKEERGVVIAFRGSSPAACEVKLKACIDRIKVTFSQIS